jgi:hypothetical protein
LNLRKERRSLVKRVYESNPIHKRLIWVRGRLDLKSSEVAKGTGIPVVNYFERENGRRTCFYEEFLVLAIYFQEKWEKKYGASKMFPYFDGDMVERISPVWLLFGEDKSIKTAKRMLENARKDFSIRELELLERHSDLENQINMFNDTKEENQ